MRQRAEMKPRSCGTTPEPSRRPVYTASRPPRSDAAADRHQLITVDVMKGSTGFGFTLGDTEHGQYWSPALPALTSSSFPL